MRRIGRKRSVGFRTVAVAACTLALAVPVWTSASTILLKDGRRLSGAVGTVTSLAESPQAIQSDFPGTVLIDDGLRRVFVTNTRVARIEEADSGEVKEKINIPQRVARNSGARVGQVGFLSNIQPFDAHGRRSVRMSTNKGPLDVFQGITQITPLYAKVEALVAEKHKSVVWEMRIATASIPRDVLAKILATFVDSKSLEQRLRVARLFLQAERYQDAQQELEGIIADFPDQKDLAKEVQALKQLYAREIVKEIEVRRKAGQHALAYAMLEQFPSTDVAGDTLQQVREMLEQYRNTQKKLELMFSELTTLVESLSDAKTRDECLAFLKGLSQELSINTMDRLASYERLSDDEKLAPEQKVSLAVSGWLVGSDLADTNLTVSLSLVQLRDLVARYLSEPSQLERKTLFERLRGLEGASPQIVAALIAHMQPPLAAPKPSASEPGFYTMQIPVGIDQEPDVTYHLQLPPHYDPHLRYPTIVTLNGENSTQKNQLDWWAGPRDERGYRLGHATRLGYIVVAVDWMKPGQSEYEYSAREHAAVTGSLRDACRRFSIDTDRVFLSGHSIGGSAAWDIALAHPDLWAGCIPIGGDSEKYCRHYWENANYVPFYVIGGELDGDKTVKNARDLDRYLQRHFDVTVVEYRGRGHEDFYEEIKNAFDWMARRPGRNFFPKEFNVVTMRTWDNFFWWFEAGKLPPRAIVEPNNWPPGHGVSATKISSKLLPTNGVSITTGARDITVWLSPEAVDFSRDMTIKVNNKPINKGSKVSPELQVILEDVRTRGDRLHPFWAKLSQ